MKLMYEVVSIKNPLTYTSCKWENLGSMSSFSSCKVLFGICSVDIISDAFDNQKQLEEVGMSKQLQEALKFWLYPVLLQLWHITELVVVKDFFWSFKNVVSFSLVSFIFETKKSMDPLLPNV